MLAASNLPTFAALTRFWPKTFQIGHFDFEKSRQTRVAKIGQQWDLTSLKGHLGGPPAWLRSRSFARPPWSRERARNGLGPAGRDRCRGLTRCSLTSRSAARLCLPVDLLLLSPAPAPPKNADPAGARWSRHARPPRGEGLAMAGSKKCMPPLTWPLWILGKSPSRRINPAKDHSVTAICATDPQPIHSRIKNPG